MVKQYSVRVEVKLVVTVDDEKTDLDSVLTDMDYDFNVADGEENAEIVTTEIMGWKITNERDDTILV